LFALGIHAIRIPYRLKAKNVNSTSFSLNGLIVIIILLNISKFEFEVWCSVAQLTIIYNLLNGLIDDSQLLGLLNLAVPAFNSRNRPTFCLSKHRTLYGYYTCIYRLLVSCNNISVVVLFYSSVAEIRDSIITY